MAGQFQIVHCRSRRETPRGRRGKSTSLRVLCASAVNYSFRTQTEPLPFWNKAFRSGSTIHRSAAKSPIRDNGTHLERRASGLLPRASPRTHGRGWPNHSGTRRFAPHLKPERGSIIYALACRDPSRLKVVPTPAGAHFFPHLVGPTRERVGRAHLKVRLASVVIRLALKRMGLALAMIRLTLGGVRLTLMRAGHTLERFQATLARAGPAWLT